ncbi:MAG: tetratricopeptide repeat protein, partial [Bacteroidota bacterium]
MTQFLKKFWGISLVLCCMSFHVHAQDEHPFGVQAIDSLLEAGNTMLAQEVLQQHISRFRSNGQIDSLYQFPIYLGKLEAKKTNSTKAASVAKDFIEELSTLTNNHRTLFKAYLSLDKLYVFLGDDASSVIASKKALEYAKTTPDVTQEELGLINYTIGGNYYALYDLSNAVDYFKASVAAYEKAETAKKDKLADAYNGVAVSMWTLNKLDIAEVYFHKAIQTTRESDLTDYDRDYYIVAFQFNLALVVDAQGNIGEAIDLKKQIISTLQDIINGSQDDFLVKKSKRLQASAISNLAAFYHDTGYLTRAYEMLQYAHDKKKEVFGVDSPRLATSAHQIATSEIELLEYDKSIATVETALKNLRKAPSRYLSVEADLLYSMAKAYSAKKEMARARELYEQSDALYREAYPDEYSREYLILLRDYAQFLVENGETELG